MDKLGRHIVAEYYDCETEVLNDVSLIEQHMIAAAEKADATVISSTFHHFSPFGVSGVIVIQESHIAIHTWPEYQYAALDIFTCGEQINPWRCYNSLLESLQAGHGSAIELGRGQLDLLQKQSKVNAPDQEQHGVEGDAVISRNIWFTERDENVALSLRHTGEHIYRESSPFQKIDIFDTYAYGKALILDGMMMTTEKDEYIYHEMMTHVAMCVHPKPKEILVVGGGDGGCIRELLKHTVEKVTMVEIDEMVVEACRKHLPGIASSLNHPKLDLHIADGIDYVQNAEPEKYDIVIIDSTDPVGPALGLFSPEFYQQVYAILKKDGIMIVQSESPRYNSKVFAEIFACFRAIFGEKNVSPYLMYIPTYPSGTWSAAFCSKSGLNPVVDLRSDYLNEFTANNPLRYYNADIHAAAFALPNYAKSVLDKN